MSQAVTDRHYSTICFQIDTPGTFKSHTVGSRGVFGVALGQRTISDLGSPGCGHWLWAPVFVNMAFECVAVSLTRAHAGDLN